MLIIARISSLKQTIIDIIEPYSEAEGEAKGEAKGEAERDKEIAKAMLNIQHKLGTDYNQIIKDMKNLGISDEAIEAARKQYEAELDQ